MVGILAMLWKTEKWEQRMIRRMKPEDLKQVIILEQQIFTRPWSEQSFLSALNQQDTIYLVEEENRVVRGYLGIWCTAEDGDLCNMAVAQNVRRSGVATGLLMQGMEVCRTQGLQRILLEVRESNLPARNLYERHGFQSIGVRKQYYRDPVEDALMMECLL